LGNKYQILIFPEGTNFAEDSKAKSNSFAAKLGKPPYDYVLHPRTTCFAFLIERMRQNQQIDAVYDMTIGYPKTLPASELDMLLGVIPEEVHFLVKRHPISDIPEDEDGIKKWCEDRWADKEKTLEKFYTTSTPSGGSEIGPNSVCEQPWNAMYFVLWAWTAFTYFFMYLTFTNWIAFWWALGCTISLLLVSRFTDGIQQIEIDLHHLLDRPKTQTQTFKIEPTRNGTCMLPPPVRVSSRGDVKKD
jgi:lysocardiolipin and lysophospholipid acyltransferase